MRRRIFDILVTLLLMTLSYLVFAYAERVRALTAAHLAMDQQLLAILQQSQPKTPVVK